MAAERRKRILHKMAAHELKVEALQQHRAAAAKRGRVNNQRKQKAWLKSHASAFGTNDPTRNSYITGSVSGAFELAADLKELDSRTRVRSDHYQRRGVTIHRRGRTKVLPSLPAPPPVDEPTPAPSAAATPETTNPHNPTHAPLHAPLRREPRPASRVHSRGRSRGASRSSLSRGGRRLPRVVHRPEFPGASHSESAPYLPPCTSVKVRSGCAAVDFPEPPVGDVFEEEWSDGVSESSRSDTEDSEDYDDAPHTTQAIVKRYSRTVMHVDDHTFRPHFDFSAMDTSSPLVMRPVVSLPQLSPTRRQPFGRREVVVSLPAV